MAAPLEELINGKGGRIFVRSWRPASAPRGVVAICHGFNAHSGHYAWAADQLVAEDLAVYALDLRGRGKSEGERFYADSIGDYLSDLTALIDRAKTREPGLPIFLLGHSAGGVISVTWALENPGKLAGLVCESSAYKVPAPTPALTILKFLAHFAPHAKAVALKNEDFSRDAAHVQHLNADPLIKGEKQPLQTMSALIRANARLKRDLPKLTLPLLILHGVADKAALPAGSRELFERASATDKTLKIYDGHVHDLLNDLGRESVIADMNAWIDLHIPAAQSRTA